MRKLKKALIPALALTLLAVGMGLAGVTSSKHDLRASNPNLSTAITFGIEPATSQVCVFCHHPHGNRGTDNPLLWNVNSTGGTYPTYNATSTTTAAINGAAAAKPQSVLCMSCHDGAAGTITFSKDALDGTLGWALISRGHIPAYPPDTLADDHPVGFVYPDSSDPKFGDLSPRRRWDSDPLAEPGMRLMDYLRGAVSNTVYPLYSCGDECDPTMECTTCHDVHNGQSICVQFMRGGETDIISGSRICRDCHTAK